MARGQLLWPFYSPVLVLPCDRAAAEAALAAAVSSARRSILATAAVSFIVVLVVIASAAVAAASFPAGIPAPFTLLVVVLTSMIIAIVPLMAYLRLAPWVSYLEELLEGLRSGRIRVEDICGKPLSLGA